MPIQFPSLSLPDQTARYQEEATNTYFPYSYSLALNNVAATYPSTDSTNMPGGIGSIKYNTIAFQADNNMAISAISLNISAYATFSFGTIIQSFYALKVTTVPTLTFFNIPTPVAAITQPTIPGDIGNDIYTWSAAIQSPQSTAGNVTSSYQNYYYLERYEPYNYLLKYNQILYIHMGVDTATAASNLGFWTVSITFHMLPTGLKI